MAWIPELQEDSRDDRESLCNDPKHRAIKAERRDVINQNRKLRAELHRYHGLLREAREIMSELSPLKIAEQAILKRSTADKALHEAWDKLETFLKKMEEL